MKMNVAKLFALMLVLLLAACGDESTSPEPGDEATETATTETVTTRATLEGAVPANGDVVRGDFLLGAIVDAPELVEVRFLVDGAEVGVVNEHPYQLEMSACDMSPGNHAYIVTIEAEDGSTDYVEQFFEVEACN